MLPGPCTAGNAHVRAAPAKPRVAHVHSTAGSPADVELASNHGDVESASNQAEESDREWGKDLPSSTPPKTPTSESKEPSLADMESASMTGSETQSTTVDPLDHIARETEEQVLAKRWQCDLCFELYGQDSTLWRLGDERCNHSLCLRCVRGSIQWGGRCPYDNTEIPPIVVCGVMGTGEYVYHEKRIEAQKIGGIMCSVADCPGVAPAMEGRPPRPVACTLCNEQHCGRIICGTPWTAGHRCWDIIDEERRWAEQEAEMRARRRHSLQDRLLSTDMRLAKCPRFRPCPQCGTMVEHIGGCNMVYHESCRTRWCFLCRRVGTCTDFDCQAPDSAPPTPRRRTPTPAVTPAVPPALKPTRTVLRFLAAAIFMFMLYTCFGLNSAIPRSRFLNSSMAASACQPASCTSEVSPTPPALAKAAPEPLAVEA